MTIARPPWIPLEDQGGDRRYLGTINRGVEPDGQWPRGFITGFSANGHLLDEERQVALAFPDYDLLPKLHMFHLSPSGGTNAA